jgi:hypothetical protein
VGTNKDALPVSVHINQQLNPTSEITAMSSAPKNVSNLPLPDIQRLLICPQENDREKALRPSPVRCRMAEIPALPTSQKPKVDCLCWKGQLQGEGPLSGHRTLLNKRGSSKFVSLRITTQPISIFSSRNIWSDFVIPRRPVRSSCVAVVHDSFWRTSAVKHR